MLRSGTAQELWLRQQHQPDPTKSWRAFQPSVTRITLGSRDIFLERWPRHSQPHHFSRFYFLRNNGKELPHIFPVPDLFAREAGLVYGRFVFLTPFVEAISKSSCWKCPHQRTEIHRFSSEETPSFRAGRKRLSFPLVSSIECAMVLV